MNKKVQICYTKNEHRDEQLRMKELVYAEGNSRKKTDENGNKLYHTIYSFDSGWSIVAVTPGKESKRKGDLNNPNDACIKIMKDGKFFNEIPAAFTGIKWVFEQLHKNNYDDLLLDVVSIFIRSAFMYDHYIDNHNHVRYSLSDESLKNIKSRVVSIFDIPVDVFFYYIDTIAMQEDIKEITIGKSINSDCGRTNNILSYIEFIAVLLGRISLSQHDELMSHKRGTNSISKSKITKIFPEFTF